MADYYTILKRAVGTSDGRSGEARRAVYEKARAALVRQLRSLDPPLAEAEITRQRLSLEEAIRRVESESAEALVRDAATALGRERTDAPVPRERDVPQSPAPPTPAIRPVAPGTPRPPEPRPPASGMMETRPARPPETAASETRPAGPVPLGPSQTAPAVPQVGPPPAPAAASLAVAKPADPVARAVDGGARQAQPGLPVGPRGASEAKDGRREAEASAQTSAKAAVPVPATVPQPAPAKRPIPPDDAVRKRPPRVPPQRTRAPRGARSSGSRQGLLIAAVVALLCLTGGGLAYWQRDALFNMLEPAQEEPTELLAGASPSNTPELPAKSTDRILPFDEQPAAEPSAEAAATEPDASLPAAEPAESEAQVAEAAPEGAEPPADASDQPVPVAQRAALYEETLEPNSSGQRYSGSVSWRVEEEEGDNDAAEGPLVIRGFVDVPDRQMKMLVTVRRNADSNLPASHTVELLFEVPPNFDAGGVANVPGILMKTSEPARGVPLVGASARVTSGYFLIGLASGDADRQRNIELLRDRGWIDIPILYNNGRRAILTLEKGLPGEQAFTEAFASWAPATANR